MNTAPTTSTRATIAREYHDHQSLRQRISQEVIRDFKIHCGAFVQRSGKELDTELDSKFKNASTKPKPKGK